MKIRIHNARILTMADTAEPFIGEVNIAEGRITYVGKDKPTNDNIWDREIDAKQNLLLPGFKNAHSHSAMTILRSYADDLPLSEWLFERVFPVEEKLTEDDIYHLTKLAILEYLTSGITAIFEMYLNPEMIACACQEMGMRCVQVGAANNFGTTPKRVAELYESLNNVHPLTGYHLGFHAEYTCDEPLLLEVAELSQHYKAPVFCHLAETAAETEGCRERHNDMTPAAYLASLGIFDHGGGGYHCVHMTAADIAIFRERGLYAVTNPASNLKLASGIAPIADYLRTGVPVAIGTDGPASNNCLDFFREMFLVTGLAKVKEVDAAAVPAFSVLQMACVNGARAMGLNEAMTITIGSMADLIMIDLNQPNMQPLNHIANNVVYSGSKQNVAMTIVNGQILYEKGEFATGIDVEDIYENANKIAARIGGRE
ncbi:MAG: amidohydrolase [Lachnospiraceae bacterium]|jgi:5-methylthioadenosine/S-adenosylhomocysteine deaminase|nr:amidohydrolase [Lachnospiraceae bacterium]